MLRGFYTATAGMISQQKRVEVYSNNMANATTPGYKSDQTAIRAFPEMLLHRMENGNIPTKNGAQAFSSNKYIGSLNTGAYMQELPFLNTKGDLDETGILSNVALLENEVPVNAETNLKGALLFAVETQNGGLRYTRNGSFSLNDNGNLSTNGNPVLSTNGNPISIQSSNFEITTDGNVIANGQIIDQIDIRYEEDVRNLAKEGNGLYRTVNDAVLPSAINNNEIQYALRQGFVEGSNVDVARSYTDMLTAYRAFEANQKVLQAYDRSMEKAANEIGRL